MLSKAEQLHKQTKPKLRQRKCKFCKKYFTPDRKGQSTCSIDCSIEHGKAQNTAKRKKEVSLAKREFRNNDRAFLLKTAQKEVNAYIRIRDRNEKCISCQMPSGFRIESGHYRSSGNNSAIRFHTLNIHAQDHKCNCHLSANLIPYRENLIKKIGIDKVLWLESQTQPKKYPIEYLKRLIFIFRKKIKLYKSRL